MSSMFEYTVTSVIALVSSVGLSTQAAKKLHLEPAQHSVKIERTVSFTTHDGVQLCADIFHPKDLKKSPTVLVRIPFSITVQTCFLEEMIGRLWAERGYTAVIQGTRGRFKSGGEFYPMKFEREDGIETLAWIARQPWYNGEIGAWGGSAYGQTLWSIADQTKPAIRSMEVYFTSTNFHEMFYGGDAFSLYSALGWTLRSHGKYKDEDEWPTTERILKAANGFPMKDSDRRDLGHSIDFFQDWIRHKSVDNYWQKIDGVDQNTKFHGSALFLAGWFDPFLPTELIDFHNVCQTDQSKITRIIIGPWSHARDVKLPNFQSSEKFRPLSVSTSLPWFNESLKGEILDRKSTPKVSLFVMGVNKWRAEDEYPLARTVFTPMYLSSGDLAESNERQRGGNLNLTFSKHDAVDKYTYNPDDPVPTTGGAMIGEAAGTYAQNQVEQRADVISYTTPPLPHDVEVTGPVKANLYVLTDAPSTDFTAKLIDVHPDGTAYNLCSGVLRRNYTLAQTTKTAPTKIEIDLSATSNVFLQGHSIRLDISSSDFPRYDRNPNTGEDAATEIHPRIAHQQIMSGLHYPSHIILPIIPSRKDKPLRSLLNQLRR